MARFDELPSEILVSIAQYVGGDSLHSNLGRLLLFKRWYNIAEPLPFENLKLSVSRILQFLPGPNVTQKRLQLLNIRNLCITYQNFDHPSDLRRHIQESLGEATWLLKGKESTIINAALDADGDNDLDIRACGVLMLLQAILPKMTGLQTFKLQVELKAASCVQTEALYILTIQTILLALPASITSLDVDIQGEQPKCRVAVDGTHIMLVDDPHHQALHVRPIPLSPTFLPSLRHLRVRLRQLCPQFFHVSPGSHAHLETLVINTCLTDNYNETSSEAEQMKYRAKICLVYGDDTHVIDPFRRRLTTLGLRVKRHFPSLKTFRIMHPKQLINDIDGATVYWAGIDVLTGYDLTITP